MTTRRRLGATAVLTGSALGGVVGALQTTIGSSIPAWTGAKASPVALGLLTILMSLLAGAAGALALRPGSRTSGQQLAALLTITVTAVVGFTTVGPLWLLPGPLLLTGAAVALDDWREIARSAVTHWTGLVLAALGFFQMLAPLKNLYRVRALEGAVLPCAARPVKAAGCPLSLSGAWS